MPFRPELLLKAGLKPRWNDLGRFVSTVERILYDLEQKRIAWHARQEAALDRLVVPPATESSSFRRPSLRTSGSGPRSLAS